MSLSAFVTGFLVGSFVEYLWMRWCIGFAKRKGWVEVRWTKGES